MRLAGRCLREGAAQGFCMLCITGGEPLLFPNQVRALLAQAKALGWSERWLFTNAFWACSRPVAKRRLVALVRNGLTGLSLSADSFHQQFIPLDHLRHLMTAAQELSVPSLFLDVRLFERLDADNPFDKETALILQRLGSLDHWIVHQGPPLLVGRAATALAPLLPTQPLATFNRCPGAWTGGPLLNPAGVDIDPCGTVSLCPGLSIGNITTAPLKDLLVPTLWNRSSPIRCLAQGGPARLASLLNARNSEVKPCYASACAACYQIRRTLQPDYPNTLTPYHFYHPAQHDW